MTVPFRLLLLRPTFIAPSAGSQHQTHHIFTKSGWFRVPLRTALDAKNYVGQPRNTFECS